MPSASEVGVAGERRQPGKSRQRRGEAWIVPEALSERPSAERCGEAQPGGSHRDVRRVKVDESDLRCRLERNRHVKGKISERWRIPAPALYGTRAADARRHVGVRVLATKELTIDDDAGGILHRALSNKSFSQGLRTFCERHVQSLASKPKEVIARGKLPASRCKCDCAIGADGDAKVGSVDLLSDYPI